MVLTLATKITIFRIILVPFFITAILYYSPINDYFRLIALTIFVIAAVSDLIDGFIARRFQQKSKLGSFLDPIADKLLLMSGFICLYKVSILFEVVRFPVWLIVAVISRDVLLLLGIMIIHLMHKDLLISPTTWGKVNTVLQMACIIGILLQWPWTSVFWYATLVSIVISAFEYYRQGVKILSMDLT